MTDIQVTLMALASGGEIPMKFALAGQNISPP